MLLFEAMCGHVCQVAETRPRYVIVGERLFRYLVVRAQVTERQHDVYRSFAAELAFALVRLDPARPPGRGGRGRSRALPSALPSLIASFTNSKDGDAGAVQIPAVASVPGLRSGSFFEPGRLAGGVDRGHHLGREAVRSG